MWRDGCVLWPAGSDRIVPQEVRLQSERGPLTGRVCRVLAKARKTTQVPLHECIVANDKLCIGSGFDLPPWCGSDSGSSLSLWCGPGSGFSFDADADPNSDADPGYQMMRFGLRSGSTTLPMTLQFLGVSPVCRYYWTAPTLPLITITLAHIFRRFYSHLPRVYTWGISAKHPLVGTRGF